MLLFNLTTYQKKYKILIDIIDKAMIELKKKRGFTLVELLVTITILGIIMAIAIPLVRRVSTSQDNKKYYKKFKTTMLKQSILKLGLVIGFFGVFVTLIVGIFI